MENRFVDNETLLNAETLNKFEADMRAFTEEKSSIPASSQSTRGGVKVWSENSVLYISTK